MKKRVLRELLKKREAQKENVETAEVKPEPKKNVKKTKKVKMQ